MTEAARGKSASMTALILVEIYREYTDGDILFDLSSRIQRMYEMI
jgi:hypothetical protein